MEEKLGGRTHKLILQNRGNASITGVTDVVSFDECQVILDTDQGLLTLKGKGLHVSRLTIEKGEVDVDGTVDSLSYSSNESLRKAGESMFSRLFKYACYGRTAERTSSDGNQPVYRRLADDELRRSSGCPNRNSS